SILHCVRLVEDDDAVEITAQPLDDLPDTRNLLVARVGAQRGVGREQDALLQTNRSEEHTSELQSPCNLVCRLLLEKKKNKIGRGLLKILVVNTEITIYKHDCDGA